MKLNRFFGYLVLISLAGCDPKVNPADLPAFRSTPVEHTLAEGLLEGASGIVDARNFSNAVWVHNDHDPSLYLLSHDGKLLKKLPFRGTSRDWEDIALGPGPEQNRNYIYIAETGDNQQVYDRYHIYRFPEPVEGQERIDNYDDIPFTYEDGKYDVEAVVLDPQTRDLYLFTKRSLTDARVYKLAYPQKVGENNTATFVKTIPYGFLTAGDASADGKEILLKNYASIFYWKVRNGETILSALDRKHDLQPAYVLEPQGEAICFDKNAGGFFTISEKGNGKTPVKLYYYGKE